MIDDWWLKVNHQSLLRHLNENIELTQYHEEGSRLSNYFAIAPQWRETNCIHHHGVPVVRPRSWPLEVSATVKYQCIINLIVTREMICHFRFSELITLFSEAAAWRLMAVNPGKFKVCWQPSILSTTLFFLVAIPNNAIARWARPHPPLAQGCRQATSTLDPQSAV